MSCNKLKIHVMIETAHDTFLKLGMAKPLAVEFEIKYRFCNDHHRNTELFCAPISSSASRVLWREQ